MLFSFVSPFLGGEVAFRIATTDFAKEEQTPPIENFTGGS
jgi:hypothetical protein